MSIETRLRETGVRVALNSTGVVTGSGTVSIGSALYLAYYPSLGTTVDDSPLSVSTGNGIAALNFQALTSDVVSAVTGDFYVQNSAGVFLKYYLNSTSYYVRLTHTDGTVAASSAGLAGTGANYITFAADGTLSADKVLTAGSNITITTAGGTITISATTNSIVAVNYGSVYLLPQQTKLYSSTSAARIDAGSAWWRLLFSPLTQQFGIWQFICPPDYGSNPYVRLSFAGVSQVAVVKSITWVVDQWGIGTDIQSQHSFYNDTFGGTNSVTIGLSAGYSSGVVKYITVPLVTVVSLQAGCITQIRLTGTGNYVDDMELGGLSFEYTRA